MNDHTEKEKIVYEDEPETSEDGDLDEVEGKVKKLKEKLKKCNEDKQEYLAGWQRAQADFINYRRKQEERKGEWVKMANENLITDLLPVIDALNHAEQHVELRGKQEREGISKIKEEILNTLKKYGLEEIKAVGEKFNPEFHEAIERIESDEEEGVVVEEAQKGYLLNGG